MEGRKQTGQQKYGLYKANGTKHGGRTGQKRKGGVSSYQQYKYLLFSCRKLSITNWIGKQKLKQIPETRHTPRQRKMSKR